MMAYRKHQKEDAIVSEVVLRYPRPISEFAQEVETNKSERESKTSLLTILHENINNVLKLKSFYRKIIYFIDTTRNNNSSS